MSSACLLYSNSNSCSNIQLNSTPTDNALIKRRDDLSSIRSYWRDLVRVTEGEVIELDKLEDEIPLHIKRQRIHEDTTTTDVVTCFDWNHLCFIAAINNSSLNSPGANNGSESVLLEVEVVGLSPPSLLLLSKREKEKTSIDVLEDNSFKAPRRIQISVPSTIGLGSQPRVIQVAAGYYHVLVLVGWKDHSIIIDDNTISSSSSSLSEVDIDGEKYYATRVYASGRGSNGELGLGEFVLDWTDQFLPVNFSENVRYIAAGDCCSALISYDGRVHTFGSGAYFRLGHGDDLDRFSPCCVAALDNVCHILSNGVVATGMKSVSCGRWHMCAVSIGLEEVYCWGWNRFNQLGSQKESGLGLGRKSTSRICQPRRISELDANHLLGQDNSVSYTTNTVTIRQLLCGARFTAILTSSNKVIIM